MSALAIVPSSSPAPWFVLRCLGDPRLRLISDAKRNTPGLLEQLGLEVYYPVVREMRPVPRRRLSHAQRASGVVLMRPRLVPFLPGILFVRMPMGFSRHDDLFDLPSVLGYVCLGERPAMVAETAIADLRKREVDGVIAGRTPARLIFRKGDVVRVAHGVLTTTEGKIEQVPDVAIEDIDADTRIRLAIEFFGRTTTVDLAAWQVEKL